MRSLEAFLLAEPPKPELVAVCGNAESRPGPALHLVTISRVVW